MKLFICNRIKSQSNERNTSRWWMCASTFHRWGPGRLPNHQHYQRFSGQKKIALWRPTCSLSTRTLSTQQLVPFTSPNVFSSSVWALVSPLPAETLWSEGGQDIDAKLFGVKVLLLSLELTSGESSCSCSAASRVAALMRKSLEVLSFMYCIRFTWTNTNSSCDQHFSSC